MAESEQEHLLNHLRDAHAIEVHAIRQLERAANGRDEENQALYEEHLEETKGHEQKLGELVEAHGRKPSPVEDKTLRGGTIGLRQLADIPLDTPVKLAMNLYALEHLEIAAYELLCEVAKRADDEDTAQAAREILEEERAAAEKVEGTFDHAVEALVDGAESSGQEGADDSSEEGEDDSSKEADSPQEDLLLSHLQDVHALEQQSRQLLKTAIEHVCQDDGLKSFYEEHLEETEEHLRLIAERIESRDKKPSAIKDLHFSAAKSGLHDLSVHPPDVHTKIAMNAFCLEHLEVAAYELLSRLADRCGDSDTVETAKKILESERKAAEALQDSFGRAVEVMFESDGSYDEVRAAERVQDDDKDGQEREGEKEPVSSATPQG